MDAIYKQRGDSIDYIPASDVAAGQVVVVEDMVAITKLDIVAGTLGALALTGVYAINKNSAASTGIAFGKKVYWDSANGYATTVDTDNDYIGKCVKAASDDDVTVQVRLCQ